MSHLVCSPLWLLLGARSFPISAGIGSASGGAGAADRLIVGITVEHDLVAGALYGESADRRRDSGTVLLV